MNRVANHRMTTKSAKCSPQHAKIKKKQSFSMHVFLNNCVRSDCIILYSYKTKKTLHRGIEDQCALSLSLLLLVGLLLGFGVWYGF